jgi:type VI secretion system protein VasD
MLGLLSACAGAPKRENLGLQISATADVNPDMQGRPSPIILHVMELNSTEQFNRLDYMGLTQPSGAALGPELLGKNQVVLQPGESRTLPLELNPMTTAIGLVAGYRDIDNAVWRKIVPIIQGKTKGLSITLEQTQIVANVSD